MHRKACRLISPAVLSCASVIAFFCISIDKSPPPVIVTEKCDPPNPTPAITVPTVLSVPDSEMNVLQTPTMPAAVSAVKIEADSKER